MSGLTSQFLLKHVRFQLSPPELANTYPFNLPAVQALACGLSMTSAVTFLVGDNGSGKSTILEALAVAWGFNAEGGSVNLRFSTRSTHSSLNQHLVISRNGAKPKAGFFLRAESYYNVLSATEDLEFMSTPAPEVMDGHAGRTGGPLHERSHGESFWDLFMDRFKPKGLYLLDEPESALSPQRQLAALCRFHDLAQAGSQFIIATHSPLLLAYPGARILLLDERGITETAYDDLALVRIYRGILADPQKQLREMLLAEDANDATQP